MSTRPTAVRRVSGLLVCSVAGLTAAALPSVGAAPAAAATDTTPGYSVQHVTVDVRVGPRGDQPCVVDADLYLPDGASSTNRVPAVLTTHGFGGSKSDSRTVATGSGFARQGYAVLAYSALGFGASTCLVSLNDPAYDGRAGSQLVDVLAGSRPYVAAGAARTLDVVAEEEPGDPRVGMIGSSYGGQVQFAVAKQDRRLDALIPMNTWNDLSYSFAPTNTDQVRGVSTATPGVANRVWAKTFFGPVLGIDGGATCPGFTVAACRAASQVSQAGYPDATSTRLARHVSVSSYVADVRVPTLVVQGQHDSLFNLQEAVATYQALQAQGTETRMVWKSGGHSSTVQAPGELDLGAASMRSTYLGNRFLDWMDRHVRGDLNAPAGPEFAYFRDHVPYDYSPATAGTAIEAAYVEQDTFSAAQTSALYLSGTGALTAARSGTATGSSSFASVPGVATSSSRPSGPGALLGKAIPTDQAGTFAAWTTPPLAEAVDLVGSGWLGLRLSAPVAAAAQATAAAQGRTVSPSDRLVLFAKVYDVAPDGSQMLQNGLVSPVRVADVTKPVLIQLPGVVQRFAAGHRIRVVVATGDASFAGNTVQQQVTVHTSTTSPSVLTLPTTSAPRFR